MGKYDHLEGKRFGRLVASRFSQNKNGHMFWECICDCGEVVYVSGAALERGNTKSCGCLRKEKARDRAIIVNQTVLKKHGEYKERLYKIWRGMKERCNNPRKDCYANYGGRGIAVCEEWGDDYLSFKKWAEENGYADGLTLERIDNSGNYEPKNCRWATRKEQANNTRRNHIIEHNGESGTIAEWAERVGVKANTIHGRIQKGYDAENALSAERYNRWNSPKREHEDGGKTL